MGDSMAERMDAGWQAARHWETECEAARAERDGHLETIRETFRVLESCGQAPDDNAPLSVNVRRVLDYLDRVTAERDLHERRAEHFQAEVQRVMQESWTNITELAALKKRVADAERVVALGYVEHSAGKFFLPSHGVDKYGTYALVRLEDGET